MPRSNNTFTKGLQLCVWVYVCSCTNEIKWRKHSFALFLFTLLPIFYRRRCTCKRAPRRRWYIYEWAKEKKKEAISTCSETHIVFCIFLSTGSLQSQVSVRCLLQTELLTQNCELRTASDLD